MTLNDLPLDDLLDDLRGRHAEVRRLLEFSISVYRSTLGLGFSVRPANLRDKAAAALAACAAAKNALNVYDTGTMIFWRKSDSEDQRTIRQALDGLAAVVSVLETEQAELAAFAERLERKRRKPVAVDILIVNLVSVFEWFSKPYPTTRKHHAQSDWTERRNHFVASILPLAGVDRRSDELARLIGTVVRRHERARSEGRFGLVK